MSKELLWRTCFTFALGNYTKKYPRFIVVHGTTTWEQSCCFRTGCSDVCTAGCHVWCTQVSSTVGLDNILSGVITIHLQLYTRIVRMVFISNTCIFTGAKKLCLVVFAVQLATTLSPTLPTNFFPISSCCWWCWCHWFVSFSTMLMFISWSGHC